MKIAIDTTTQTMIVENDRDGRHLPLYSGEAFEILSQLWVRTGWALKYSYSFTWMGRPIIQLPEDLVRLQEALYRVKPDVIVETGIAHGGSLIFHASLAKAMGVGRVIGIDVEIREENRRAIEGHALSPYITMVEGDSASPDVVRRVCSLIMPPERVLVILDSNHTRKHVRAELEAYHALVSRGSYLIATDGVMRDLTDVPGGSTEWKEDNPAVAVSDFLAAHAEFTLEAPSRQFDQSEVPFDITYWPSAWLRRGN